MVLANSKIEVASSKLQSLYSHCGPFCCVEFPEKSKKGRKTTESPGRRQHRGRKRYHYLAV